MFETQVCVFFYCHDNLTMKVTNSLLRKVVIMEGLIEYLRWRGDLTFKHNHYNNVDGAIFSRIAYLPFDGSEIGHKLGETFRIMIEKKGVAAMGDYNLSFAKLLTLCPRFAKSTVLDVEQLTKSNPALQFAANTVRISKKEIVISYRGTDSTIIGADEDATMSYSDVIQGQKVATAYLTKIANKFPKDKIYIVGHSKGGNYAGYAAANVPSTIQDRIVSTVNFDGPGYTQLVYNAKGFKRIMPKMRTYIPESSLFGIMLDHPERTIIVKSSFPIWAQHDPMRWTVARTSFVLAKGLSRTARIIRHALIKFNTTIPAEQRSQMLNSLFSAFEDQNITDMSQFTEHKLMGTLHLSRAYLSMTSKEREVANQVVRDLVSSTSRNLSHPSSSRYPLSNDSKRAPIFFESYSASK